MPHLVRSFSAGTGTVNANGFLALPKLTDSLAFVLGVLERVLERLLAQVRQIELGVDRSPDLLHTGVVEVEAVRPAVDRVDERRGVLRRRVVLVRLPGLLVGGTKTWFLANCFWILLAGQRADPLVAGLGFLAAFGTKFGLPEVTGTPGVLASLSGNGATSHSNLSPIGVAHQAAS